MEAATPIEVGGRKFPIGQLLMAAVALIVVAGLGYVAYDRFLAKPAYPPINGTPVKVARGDVAASVSATGAVVATRQSRLTMQATGRLKELPVKMGDQVKAGAVLARLDTAPLELKLAQAKSLLKTNQIKLDQLKAGARPEEIAQAEAAVASAQGRLNDLQAGALPQDIQQAQAAAEAAAAQVRQAQAKLDALRAGPTPDVISAAEQGVQAAQAQLDKANADLARLTSPSPDELAQAQTQVDKAKAALAVAQANYDKIAWKADKAARQEGVVLQQATLDYQNALAQLRLKQQPRQSDVEAAQKAVDAAQAQVQAAQAKLAQLKAGPTDEDVRQAQAAVDAAAGLYQQALARVDARKAGAKPGDVQAAQAAVQQAQQALAIKKQPATAQDIALAEEQVNAAQLAIQQAQLDLDNATLVAPFDGVVGPVVANVGEQIANGSVVLMLVDPKAIRVDASVDEADVAKLAPGKAAQISFDALPDKKYGGKIVGIAPNATFQGGGPTYTVSVSFDDPSVAIPPGATANVSVVTAEKKNVVLIPNRAIKRFGRSPSVDVLVGPGRTEPRAIKTGLGNDQVTEVTEGLAEGETVVIPQSAQFVQPQASATPAPGAPARR